MPEYKKQHYVPAKYLKDFSDDGYLWLYNGDQHKRIHYKSQNQEDYFYTKVEAEATEKIVGQGERNLFDRLENLDSVIKSELESAMLLFSAIDLYLRNPKHNNDIDTERSKAIENLHCDYITQIFLGLKQTYSKELEGMFYYLTTNWRLGILKISEDSQSHFITSDCPTVIFSEPNLADTPLFVFLPISHKKGLFFTNISYYFFNQKLQDESQAISVTESDILSLNTLTTINANNRIYSYHELSKSEQTYLKLGIKSEEYKTYGSIQLTDGVKTFSCPPMLTFNPGEREEFSFLIKHTSKPKSTSYKEALRLYEKGIVSFDSENIRCLKKIPDRSIYGANLIWQIRNRAQAIFNPG
jgi:hypothetical protein